MRVKIGNYRKHKSGRKEKVRIDPWDTYCMDETLALIIHPMLVQLRETAHGYPSEFYNEGDKKDEGLAKWQAILDKMINSFATINKTNPLYGKDFPTTESYMLALDLEDILIQEGLELFGKYFRSLWD